jgi:Domain of unknown function (DUF4157)
LTVGAADDAAERQADRVAAHVMRVLGRSPAAPERGAVRRSPTTRIRRGSLAMGRDGGPVGEELEGKIRRAQHGGVPLDRDTRQRMEGAFGIGFANVRVHADSPIAPEIGAAAFTHGEHIHFASGHYDTASTSGQGLLSHELAHVVQQSAVRPAADADSGVGQTVSSSPPGPLRRKVGFEFETGIPIRTKDLGSDSLSKLSYQTKVYTARTGLWKVVADSSNMEFVTEPFVENDTGRGRLSSTMDEIQTWAGGIPAVVTLARSKNPPEVGRVDEVLPNYGTAETGELWKPFLIAAGALTDAQVTASPQATGGVRLEQIPALVRAMLTESIAGAQPAATGLRIGTLMGTRDAALTDENVALKQQFADYEVGTGVRPVDFSSTLVGMNIYHAWALAQAEAMAGDQVDKYVANLGDLTLNFDKLKGLLTLVVSYILVGHRQPTVFDYSKLIAPLMARTNFYTMYRLLRPHEKTAFTDDLVLTAARLPGTGGSRMYNKGFPHDGRIDRGPTRAEWINSIKNGVPWAFGVTARDLMSQGSGSAAAANSTSLGSMTEADTSVGGNEDLAVLELRRLPQNIHRLEWKQMALKIFDVIVALP